MMVSPGNNDTQRKIWYNIGKGGKRMNSSKRIAECGMICALCAVIMIVGNIIGVGLYASPMFAGLFLIPLGKKYGQKYHLALWLAVSLISFLTVSEVEQNLMFFCFFGCYPILQPHFLKIRPKLLRRLAKGVYFNVVILTVELLVMYVLTPEVMSFWMLFTFMVLFNLTFICFDFVIPRFELLLNKYLGKFKR